MSSVCESLQSSDSPSGDSHKLKVVDSVTDESLHDLLNPEKMRTNGRNILGLSADTRPRLNHHFELDECPDTDELLAPRRKHKYGGSRHKKSLVLQDQSNKLCYYAEISIPKPDPVLCVKRRKCRRKRMPRKTKKHTGIYKYSDDDFLGDQENQNSN